jgi:hypothetical protein
MVGTCFSFEYQLGAALGLEASVLVSSSSSYTLESLSLATNRVSLSYFGSFSSSLPAKVREYSTAAVDSSNFGLGFAVTASNYLISESICYKSFPSATRVE